MKTELAKKAGKVFFQLASGFVLSSLLTACGFFGGSAEVNPKGNAVAQTAYKQLGQKYRSGGASPGKGFDCSGLIYWVYRKNGYKNVPRISSDQAKYGVCVSKKELQAGDILIFRTGNSPRGLHSGIYTGDKCFIHSPSSGKVVRLDSVESPYWKKRFVTARRVTM